MRPDAAMPLSIRSISVAQTSSAVTAFIGQNPALMPTLTVDERSGLLKTLASSIGLASATKGQQCAMTEAAALRLLNTAAPGQLAEITNALGGAAWIQSNITRFATPDLRAMALSMTSLGAPPEMSGIIR